jgi:hypothetical protein
MPALPAGPALSPAATEVLLGAGYALALVIVAWGLERLARRAHHRSERYETAGFVYHRTHDLWECPTGQHLRPTRVDHVRRLTYYRARPETCNRCPLKPDCTDADDGREVVHSVAPWPHSEVSRFYIGLSLLLVSLAALVSAVALVRHAQAAEAVVLAAPLTLAVLLGTSLLPAVRADPLRP